RGADELPDRDCIAHPAFRQAQPSARVCRGVGEARAGRGCQGASRGLLQRFRFRCRRERMTTLEPNRNEAERFLKALDPAQEPSICLQTYEDDTKRKKERAEENKLRKKQGKLVLKDPLARWRYGTLAEHLDELVKLNERGAGIYFTVNETDGN